MNLNDAFSFIYIVFLRTKVRLLDLTFESKKENLIFLHHVAFHTANYFIKDVPMLPDTMRTSILLLIAGLAFLTAIALMLDTAEGRDIHVDKDNAQPWPAQTGSEDFPYSTIQRGLDNANDGDHILVHESGDTYAEDVHVDVSVTITGDSPESVEVHHHLNPLEVWSDDVIIEKMTISGTGAWTRVYLHGSDNAVIRNCVIRSVGRGIRVFESDSVEIYDNTIEDIHSPYRGAIVLDTATSANIHNNTVMNSTYILDIYGGELEHYDHQIADSNTLDGKPVKYYRNLEDETFSYPENNISFLGFYNCENITIEDTDIEGNLYGLLLAGCDNMDVKDSRFSDGGLGIEAVFSTNIYVSECEVYNQSFAGISVSESSNVELSGNQLLEIEHGAVRIWGSDSIVIDNNTFTRSGTGCDLFYADDIIIRDNEFSEFDIGIYFFYSYNNFIRDNTLYGSADSTGISMWLNTSSNNRAGNLLENNQIYNSDTGIFFHWAIGSTVRHSAFQGCEKAIVANESEILIEDSTFSSNDIDIELNGAETDSPHFNSTALNTTLEPAKLQIDENCTLLEKHHLSVLVLDKDSRPIQGADLFVRALDPEGEVKEICYATPAYEGSDESTPRNGKIENLTVIYREHTEDGFEEFVCRINASYEEIEEMVEVVIDNEKTVEISLDTAEPENRRPVVEITSPGDDETVQGTIPIKGTASDPEGNETVQNVELRIEEGPWLTASGTTSWEYEYDTTFSMDGSCLIEARAFDGEGYSSIVSITIHIGNIEGMNTPPVIEELRIDKLEVEQEESLLLTGKVKDEDGEDDIARILIQIYNGTGAVVKNFTGSVIRMEYGVKDAYLDFSLVFRAEGGWEGNYTIKVSVTDNLDNSATRIVSFQVREKGPGEEDEDDEIIEGIDDTILFFGIIPAIIVIASGAIFGVHSFQKKSALPRCPRCGGKADYIEEYEAYYCWDCEDYL